MAILNFLGGEAGDLSEFQVTSGTVAIESSIKRTGSYAYRVTPVGAGGARGQVVTLGADGKNTNLSGTTLYCTCYIYFVTLPSANYPIFEFGQSVSWVYVDNTGAITITQVAGGGASSSAATLTTGVWYRIDVKSVRNGTCTLSVDGGTQVTCTGSNLSDHVRAYIGTDQTATYDMVVDDFVISDTGFATTPEVYLSKPTGAGTYTTGWGNGTGSTYAEVDEVPHDSATTYLQDTSGTNTVKTFTMQSKSTISADGNIVAVKPMGYLTETSSTTTLAALRMRSGSTDSDTTAVDIGAPSPNFVLFSAIHETDPNTSAAWADAAFNAIEVGPKKTSDNSSIRCTAIYAMVLTDGFTATTVSPSAISSTETVPSPVLKSGLTLTGIASEEAFGTATIRMHVTAEAIASAEAFGDTEVRPVQAILPSGIASLQALGTPAVQPQPYTVSPSSIASEEAIGEDVIGRATFPSSIVSLEAFGTPALSKRVTLTGIASAEAIGAAQLNRQVVPTGIVSAGAFGTAVITVGSVTITVIGIDSEEVFGDHLVTAATISGFRRPPPGSARFTPAPSPGSARYAARPPAGAGY